MDFINLFAVTVSQEKLNIIGIGFPNDFLVQFIE